MVLDNQLDVVEDVAGWGGGKWGGGRGEGGGGLELLQKKNKPHINLRFLVTINKTNRETTSIVGVHNILGND